MAEELVSPLPEEMELRRKQSELETLELNLADQELKLATLTARLAAFERRYLHLLGRRYAELDELEAQLAEVDAPAGVAQAARARAAESASAAGASQDAPPTPHAERSETLKQLYRHVAKQLHPDLTVDEDERKARTKAMAEVNEAYARGDEQRLNQIFSDWKRSQRGPQATGTGADLVRVIRLIAQAQQRLLQIRAETRALRKTALFKLRREVRAARRRGRNLLKEMAQGLDKKIDLARERLAGNAGRRTG